MELPFLYQTRTILRKSGILPRWPVSGVPRDAGTRSLHLTIGNQIGEDRTQSGQDTQKEVKRQSTKDVKSQQARETYLTQQASVKVKQQANGERQSYLKQKAAEIATKQVPPRSTLTREEQRAFVRLQSLAIQQQYVDRSPDADRLGTDVATILELFPGPPQRQKSSSQEAEDSEAGFRDYTPFQAPLDNLAREGQENLTKIATKQHSPSSTDDFIAKICLHQLQHYYTLFDAALKSTTQPRDLSAFSILKTQIFPLIDLIAPPSTHIPKTRTLKLKELLPISTLTSQLFPNSKSTPPTIHPLPILTRLYPAAILLALRLLTKHQPLSPITSSLLPEIRKLGPTSYVLGCSTHFYNTFLLLRWNTFSSLREVCDLLGEMERGGVEFDRGTARFLADVAEERTKDLTTQPGAAGPDSSVGPAAPEGEVTRGAAWWGKSEQVKWWGRVVEWRAVIARRLEEKGQGEVIREGPHSALMEEELATSSEAADREVWL